MNTISSRSLDEDGKFKRNAWLIKSFMALATVAEVLHYANTGVIDFGRIAGLCAVLLFLKGLLLPPLLLIAPMSAYSNHVNLISFHTKVHYAIGLVLLLVSTL